MGKISKIVKKRIGRTDHTFFVEGDNLHQLIMEERKLSFGDVLNCGLCGGDDGTTRRARGTHDLQPADLGP